MKKIDEGLVNEIALGIFNVSLNSGVIMKSDEERIRITALAIQSYLKKEGWVRLPGKYVVKKGYLERVED